MYGSRKSGNNCHQSYRRWHRWPCQSVRNNQLTIGLLVWQELHDLERKEIAIYRILKIKRVKSDDGILKINNKPVDRPTDSNNWISRPTNNMFLYWSISSTNIYSFVFRLNTGNFLIQNQATVICELVNSFPINIFFSVSCALYYKNRKKESLRR